MSDPNLTKPAQAAAARSAAPAPLIAPDDVPYLPRGVRLERDRVRDIRVLQAPERAMRLDAIGEAILAELDGVRSVGTIAATLADRYAAPVDQITADMRDFLTGLVERRMVFLKDAS